MSNNEIVQLKSYDENTGQEIGNVLPITNSEAVKTEDNKTLKQKLTEINKQIEQTNASLDNKANEIDLAIERNRINNLIIHSGEGTEKDAEVVDARVGVDGTVYDTLGKAIREQIGIIKTNVDNKIYTIINRNDVYFRIGTIGSNGALGNSKNRVVSSFVFAKKGSTFSVNSGYKFSLAKYSLANQSSFIAIVNTRTTDYILDEDCYIRFTVGSSNDATITDTSISQQINVNIITKNREISSNKLIPLENGYISTSTGKLVDNLTNAKVYMRTPCFIDVTNANYLEVDIIGKDAELIVVAYDKNNNIISSTTGNGFTIDETIATVKVLYKNADGVNGDEKISLILYGTNTIEEIKNLNTEDTITHFYHIGEGYYNSFKVKLPSNYTQKGIPVPLIIFVQGSADYSSITSTQMTNSYDEYYNYLRDNGYAVFSCYGWGNKYVQGASTFGLPINLKCYELALERLLRDYNIDPKKIALTSKSLGGVQAEALCYQNKFNIKCCGMLAPQLDFLYTNPFAYDKNKRMAIATELKFVGNVDEILNTDDFKRDANFKDFLLLNKNQLCGNNAYWKNLTGSTLTQKIENSFNKVFDEKAMRYCNIPTKIWISEDDEVVPYELSKAYIEQLQNGGCKAELRTMPNNTGGHHSVDNDVNALTETNVTTSLGVFYSSVPTAYFELINFFNENL